MLCFDIDEDDLLDDDDDVVCMLDTKSSQQHEQLAEMHYRMLVLRKIVC